MKIKVLGAGVIGLTCAFVLLEGGHDVTVVYEDPPFNTTSAVATAIWHMYLVDPNDSRNLEWSQATLARLIAMANVGNETGVYLVRGVELFRRSEPSVPSWSSIPPMFSLLTTQQLADYPGISWGYRIAAPLADMATYLGWLFRSVWSQGARFTCQGIGQLDELYDECDVVVNATGLGARNLIGDEDLIGVRGQYLVLEKPNGVSDEYIGDDENPDGMTYVIPRKNDVLIGGTEEYGFEDLTFDCSVEHLVKRCSEFVPWLASSASVAIRERVVGIRPWRRSGVRLDTEEVAERSLSVIHCYGHGGSGFSMSWGCAETVAALVAAM